MNKQIRQVKVLSTKQITPHLQRIVIGSEELKDLTDKVIGNYVKVLIPKKNEIDLNIKTACMRSYTIADVDPKNSTLILDFVINMHQGPGTLWAQTAKIGDRLAIVGPGPKKLEDFNQPHYLLLGDLTSVNAIKGYLQQLPTSAKIDAFIHIPTEQDIIDLNTPHSVNWIVTNTPEKSILIALSNLTITEPLAIVFMALEAGLVSTLKTKLHEQYSIPRTNIVASGYWKKGFNSECYKQQRQQQAQKIEAFDAK